MGDYIGGYYRDYYLYTRLYWGYTKAILGLYGDNGKENGNYYNGFGC